MRVVLIDDEKAMLLIMKSLLNRLEGVTVAAAFQNGAQALEWLRSEEADVAFVDIRMAEEDGVALARRIHAVRENIRIVFVTSHKDFALDAFEVGAVDYIVKPVRIERLEQALGRIAGRKRDAAPATDGSTVPLKAVCFGGMNVISRYGEIRWRTAKCAELFAYLLMTRGRGAARERLLEDVFDGIATRNRQAYLSTTLYQVRHTLKQHGYPAAVRFLNGSYNLQPGTVTSDFAVFEERVAAINMISESNYMHAYETERLFAGGLFEGKEFLWSMAEKERLSMMYTRFSKRLGRWLLEHGQTDLASDVAMKLVSFNETDEEANALLLNVFAAAGDRQALAAHYARYAELLREEFSERPSPEMNRLYERLTAELGG